MQRILTVRLPDKRLLRWGLDFSEYGTLRINTTRWSHKRPWARLSFCQCSCCPLQDGPYATCPVAEVILEYALDLAERSSCEEVSVSLRDEGERIQAFAPMALQDVVGELIRLAVYQAGCPIGRKVKPAMAGLALFPSQEEVLAALGRHFAALGGEAIAIKIMADLHEVFCSLGRRLGAAGSGDVYLNAVVVQEALAALFRLTAPERIRSIALGDG
ncbi:MAG: hypothetical protein JXR77_05150 [Lentisphaeria bacterium]|nr:hypothetical protein [Lentisphaeria bacterium]